MGGDKSAIEAGLKYFLVQACGSLVVLQSGMILRFIDPLFSGVLVLRLVLKAGGAPLHGWLPMISAGLSWPKLGFLFRVQKLAPLTLLYYIRGGGVTTIFVVVILLCSITGTVGGVNEIHLKKLLRFSSIRHFGWMCLAILNGGEMWLFYYLRYCVMLLRLVAALHKYQLTSFTQLTSKEWGRECMLIRVSFLSLGGIPPFLGFLPKWLVVIERVKRGFYFVIIFVVVFRLIALFYYMRASLSLYVRRRKGASHYLTNEGRRLRFVFLTLNLLRFWVGRWMWAFRF